MDMLTAGPQVLSDKAEPGTNPTSSAGPTSTFPHAMAIDDVVTLLGSHADRGLDADQVAAARGRYGYNELTETPPPPWWTRLLRQFRQLVIWILIAASVISAALGDWVDAAVILAIVVLNGLLGFLQEERAGRALAALRRLSAPQSRVIRGGISQLLPARELVPGDLIELEAGDHVPADARLVHSTSLRVQEAALTGESSPSSKDHRSILEPKTALGDRRNMIHMATVVAGGQASAVVVATGMRSELGRIAGMLAGRPQEQTPLQVRLEQLGKVLILVCVAAVTVIFGLQLARGGALEDVFLLSVSLTVAAVPEGLPAVVTIALALGLQRMARRNALIRRLPSVETLGCVTVICSDKTGTLTRNEMTVRELFVGGESYSVTGAGYAPRGEFLHDTGGVVDLARADELRTALLVGAWCNHADVQPLETGDAWRVIGDPTEGALLVAAEKAGLVPRDRKKHVLFEIPFDSDRKAMSVVITAEAAGRGAPAGAVMYTKGAPEVVLAMCDRELGGGHPLPLTPERKKLIASAAADMASRALRVLGLAYREHDRPVPGETYAEQGLVFAGLVGMLDPPREEAKDAVRRCRSAGIRPVMITGDHPSTAIAIARELGIESAGQLVLSGRDIDELSDAELGRRSEDVSVFARVTAEHKLRVVRGLRSRGHVVAMTGDGVNDAPAVEEADIGIAMGVTGTDVTKAASDMVLLDDNFASIVNAVEEGRGIFDNIQKFVHYLLASNASEVMFMLAAALFGWPIPLLAIHILWINLVSDSLPALGLGAEPTERDAMSRRPRSVREPVISWRRGWVILAHGALMAAAAAVAFSITYAGDAGSLGRARTAAFFTIAFSQLFYSVACRSTRHTMPELGLFQNIPLLLGIVTAIALQAAVGLIPVMQRLLTIVPMSLEDWTLAVGLALVPATVVEMAKWLPDGRSRA